MPICILPAILANQIAAGEVVERPASVVKELVENSLDAGADRIEIDIDKGGCKLIRIRDNGGGVPQEELVLALSRHATSKVATLDDLEAIASLGFRGEALASISAVSRLTFTSRPAKQEQAWQACAEGRDMQVTVKPAAHPVGTTVEVVDLFFNTPARRKFLRSEKTEFAHIDELLRRLALSRFDVSLQLRHNGKLLRQYRAASTPAERQRRLSAACGQAFLAQALQLESRHQGLALHGWLRPPQGSEPIGELQYSYVNGRMMRDRLINHAIRQACVEALGVETLPAYVLYLEVDPRQVDVNVHPAKHEVRFHDARLVHDFIVQVIRQGLQQALPMAALPEGGSPPESACLQTPLRPSTGHAYRQTERPAAGGISEAHRQGYQALMTTLPPGAASTDGSPGAPTAMPAIDAGRGAMHHTEADGGLLDSVEAGWRALQLCRQRFLLIAQAEQLRLLDLVAAEQALLAVHLVQQWPQGLTSQPLLMPLSLGLSAAQRQQWQVQQAWLQRLGVEGKAGRGESLMLYRVPAALRHCDLARQIPVLLAQLAAWPPQPQAAELEPLCHWLASHARAGQPSYTLARAGQLLAQLQQQSPAALTAENCSRPVLLDALIEEFSRD